MGYTVYFKAKQALADEQVRAALRFLALEHDSSVLKVEW